MMIPGGDRNMLDWPAIIVVYNIKDNKSAFFWLTVLCLISDNTRYEKCIKKLDHRVI
jgi:hypothetical protein